MQQLDKGKTGTTLKIHEDTPTLLWASFKERLGVSDFNQMLFNLTDLIQQADGLSSLEEPFSL
jgi:hypothetical protein